MTTYCQVCATIHTEPVPATHPGCHHHQDVGTGLCDECYAAGECPECEREVLEAARADAVAYLEEDCGCDCDGGAEHDTECGILERALDGIDHGDWDVQAWSCLRHDYDPRLRRIYCDTLRAEVVRVWTERQAVAA